MKTALGDIKFADLQKAFATKYGVTSVAQQFNVAPSIAQEFFEKLQESNGFLKQINYLPVDDLKGDKVYLAVDDPISSRTNFTDKNNERKPVNPSSLSNKFYELYEVDADVELEWAKIDAWSKFKDFFTKFMAQVNKRRAKDKIMCGWHGTSVADQTDLAANPLLEDLNIGWLELLRRFDSGSQVITEIVAGSGKVKIGGGEGADFKNLDETVADVKQNIPEIYRGDGDLIVILGSNLIDKYELKYWATHGDLASEKLLVDAKKIMGTFGGLSGMTVPHFPINGILVTSLNNLSIYYQASSVRRSIKDKVERKCIQDFMSINEGYVVENELKAVYVESDSVELVD
ncbi:MAG: phage major capsid protein, P2 family [Algicola sp.]|nr:phage major capsid protein, P2 family [Algicola sp.]